MMRKLFSTRLSFGSSLIDPSDLVLPASAFVRNDACVLPHSLSSPLLTAPNQQYHVDHEFREAIDSDITKKEEKIWNSPLSQTISRRLSALTSSFSLPPLSSSLSSPLSSGLIFRTSLSLSLAFPSQHLWFGFRLRSGIIAVIIFALLLVCAFLITQRNVDIVVPLANTIPIGKGIAYERNNEIAPVPEISQPGFDTKLFQQLNDLFEKDTQSRSEWELNRDRVVDILPSCAVVDSNFTLSLLRYASLTQHVHVHANCSRYPLNGDCQYQDVIFRPRWLVLHVIKGHSGGFGDRMKGLLTLLSLAMVTGRAFALNYDDYVPFSDIYGRSVLEWVMFENLPYELRYDRIGVDEVLDLNKPPENYVYDPWAIKIERLPTTLDLDWFNLEHPPVLQQGDLLKEWDRWDLVRVRHNLNSFTDILDNPHLSDVFRQFGFHSITEKGDLDLYWECLMDFAFTFTPQVTAIMNPLLVQFGRAPLRTWDESVELRKSKLFKSPSEAMTSSSRNSTLNSSNSTHNSSASSTAPVLFDFDRREEKSQDESAWLSDMYHKTFGTRQKPAYTLPRLYCAQLRMGTNGKHDSNHTIAFKDSEAFLSENQFEHIFSQFQTLIESDLARQQEQYGVVQQVLFITSDSDDFMNVLPAFFRNMPFVIVPGPTSHMDKIDQNTARDYNSTLAAFVKVVVTHYILGECDVAIISASGFGATSRWRTRNRGLFFGQPLTRDVYQGTYRVANSNTTLVAYRHRRSSGGREDVSNYTPIPKLVQSQIHQSLKLDNEQQQALDPSIYQTYQASSSLNLEVTRLPRDPLFTLPQFTSKLQKLTTHALIHSNLTDLDVIERTLSTNVVHTKYYLDCVASFANRSHTSNQGVSVVIGIMSSAESEAIAHRTLQRRALEAWHMPSVDDVDQLCSDFEQRAILQRGRAPDFFEEPSLSRKHELKSTLWSHRSLCGSQPLARTDMSWWSYYDRVDIRFVVDRSRASVITKLKLDKEQTLNNDLVFVGEWNSMISKKPDSSLLNNANCSFDAQAFALAEKEDLTAFLGSPLDRDHAEWQRLTFIRHAMVMDRRHQRILSRYLQCSSSAQDDPTRLFASKPVNNPIDFLAVVDSSTFIHLPNLINKLRGFKSKGLDEIYFGMLQHSPEETTDKIIPSRLTFTHSSLGFVLSADLATFFASNQADVVIQAWQDRHKRSVSAESDSKSAFAWGYWLIARGRLLGRDQVQSLVTSSWPDPELTYKSNRGLIRNLINAMPNIYDHPLSQTSYSLPQFHDKTIMVSSSGDEQRMNMLMGHFQCSVPRWFDWRTREFWLKREKSEQGYEINSRGDLVEPIQWYNRWG